MRTFTKSIVFAVAMLLSVSVWAGNPENAPVCNNVQNAVTVQPANEVKDVQEKPCIVSMTICGRTELVYVGSFSSNGCQQVQDAVSILAFVFSVAFGCGGL